MSKTVWSIPLKNAEINRVKNIVQKHCDTLCERLEESVLWCLRSW